MILQGNESVEDCEGGTSTATACETVHEHLLGVLSLTRFHLMELGHQKISLCGQNRHQIFECIIFRSREVNPSMIVNVFQGMNKSTRLGILHVEHTYCHTLRLLSGIDLALHLH